MKASPRQRTDSSVSNLHFGLLPPNQRARIPKLLVEVRSEVRAQKLWALSDQIRDKLAELGVTIEDGKEGSSWRWG